MGYPSGGDFFGSGFVQGLGQSLQMLPGIMAEKRRREIEAEEINLKKAILTSQQKQQEAKDKLFNLYTSDPQKFMQQIGGGLLAALNGQGGGSGQSIAAPAPAPASPLRDSLVGSPAGGGPLPGIGGGPAPDATAAAPQVPQPAGTPGQPPTGQGEYTLNSATINPFDPTKMSFNVGRRKFTNEMKPVDIGGQVQFMNHIYDDQGRLVARQPVENYKPVPPDTFLKAREEVGSLGVPPGQMRDQLAGEWLAAQNLSEPARTKQFQAIQQQAQIAGQAAIANPGASVDLISPDIGEAVKAGQKMEAEGAGLKTTAEAEARAKVEQETAGPVAEAKARGTAAAQLRPAKMLVSKLSDLIDGIKLPTTGSERVSEAPRLYGESFKQSNQNIVLYETLKDGFLATIARAAGERGVLTDQDTRRAAALFPVVVPGIGRLPDTKETAKNKMNQIRSLLDEFVRRDPGYAGNLSSLPVDSGAGGFQLQRLVPTR